MLVLDACILEAVIQPTADLKAGRWLAGQIRKDLYTTSLAQATIRLAVEQLPPGKRRTDTLVAVDAIFEFFAGRVLPFDPDAARAYAGIVINRKMMSRELAPVAAMVAAIARSRGATLATRHSADFIGCGVRVVSPWE